MSWLLTVARRRLIDHWRAESSRARGISELINSLSPTGDVVLETPVDETLASLPQHYRAALTLRYLEGFSVSEVSEALDLTYKATESVLTRARTAFAKSYLEYADET